MAILKITDKIKCCGCGICSAICPQKCIEMRPSTEGFLYPNIDISKCTECSLCKNICPTNSCLPNRNIHFPVKVYACKNKNKSILSMSSSGAFFYEIGKWVIEKGGCVFGVKFDDNMKAIHAKAENINELKTFLGSKYVQSDKDSIWLSVKNELKKKRLVLFSGTPCEIGALRNYLQKDYENLILIDFICMGVPSPMILRKHLDDIEKKYKSKIATLSFRSKKYGANSHSLSIKFSNGKEYFRALYAEPYIKSFHSCISLRESCHNCCYKKSHRESDITMADFWGINTTNIKLSITNGISMIIIHSPTGKIIFDNIASCFDYEQSSIDVAQSVQPMLTSSCNPSKDRNAFFEDFNQRKNHQSFKEISHKYVPISKQNIMRSKIKEIGFIRQFIQKTKGN
ncbi:Coenzyme F420 hydrogenase/dehydrogenase, beta subunit C-terminal domain [Bacteroides sp. 224]|uniref:Coenzyme F420 hydrogenase/dehydrogenase, beta subunit C-terminal domain n=1 Tax=Bacteroides sp. 224 TaxID=2302936 RepID=UPI0013D8349A|nr:Coenzyme F420 hydrogenase/dehydrogenase, beta subunit C-terminal domain [Bacteroides sp. 224]NDV66989.1 4Fe-4S dicluster domain-containing protein [Bacteroides sp. 224]